MSQPYRDFSGHSGDGVTAGQSGDGGSSQDVSGVGIWTGTRCHLWTSTELGLEHSTTSTPTSSWSRSSFDRFDATTAAIGTDFDRCYETRKPTTAATTTQQPPVGVPERERLTMDTKWIPAMPLPSFKQWVSRSRELSGFRDWAEKLGGWLALIHDQYGPELREALRMEEPIVLRGADQELRARRLFHLIQQAFTGYPKIEHMIRNQIMARGAADANGYELFRLIRREFSIYSRQEALYYRELVLKFTVKKPSIDGLIDVLREIQTEIESFHSMLQV